MALAGSARASLLYYDGFDYGDTNQALTSAATDWAGSSNIQYQSAGLSYAGLSTEGGSIVGNTGWNNGAAQQVAVTFGTPIDVHSYSELWMSVLVAMKPGAPSVGNVSFTVGLSIQPNSWQSVQAFNFGKAWGSGSTTTPAQYTINGKSTGANIGEETALLVMRIPSTGTTSGWVNPDLSSIPTGGTDGISSTAFNAGLQNVFFSATAMGIRVDELRIGTDFASVVPEPGTAALFLTGAVLLAGRTRRARRASRGVATTSL
jgi:hypothetical protein